LTLAPTTIDLASKNKELSWNECTVLFHIPDSALSCNSSPYRQSLEIRFTPEVKLNCHKTLQQYDTAIMSMGVIDTLHISNRNLTP
jgi:hypothetical protein